MGTMQQQTQEPADIEYSVYVYFDPKQERLKCPWEMKGVTDSMEQAMQDAETYHNSQQYHRVEVKKKYFDTKTARMMDMTLKIFEAQKHKKISGAALAGGASAIAVIGMVCGYFITIN